MAALASHHAAELSLALPRGMMCGPGSHWFHASSLTKQKAKRIENRGRSPVAAVCQEESSLKAA